MNEELDDTPKKAKKLAQKKKKEINELADNILANTAAEDTLDESDIVIQPEDNTKYDPIPGKEEDKPEDRRPVQFDQGLTKSSAFIIQKRNEEIGQILDKYFGRRNGDYFIGNENTSTTYVNGQRKRYKCIAVEDKNRFRYILWFDITNTGSLY